MFPAQISKKIAPVPYFRQSFRILARQIAEAVKDIIV
jgi:hypothetical protein